MNWRRAWPAAALVLSLAGAPCAGAPAARPEGAPDDATAGAAARLAARLLGSTPLEDDLRFLCDRIGGRASGTPACERSVDWFAERFREAGADRVWTEGFQVPVRWEEGRSEAVIVAPEPVPLRVVGMPFSPGTARRGLEAPVVDLGAGGAEAFEREGGRLRGALILVTGRVLESFEDLFLEYMDHAAIQRRAEAAGAAGILFSGTRRDSPLYRHIAGTGSIVPLPVAILAREDGLRLGRLAAAGRIRLRLTLLPRIGPQYTSRNVLAEIRGRERPEEVVLAGAHLDSWDFGTGALDNGVNCAMLLDVARQMAALPVRPRRTVRFALFTGEEQGMWGSLGYVRAHRAELDRHAAAAVFDTGTGRILGFSLGGRDDLRPFVEEALRPVAGYGANGHTADAFVGTDNFDFLLEGVPNLVANQAPANYMEHYHASTDTLDKVDLREVRSNAAVAGALLWGLAEGEGRARRQDRDAVAGLLGRTGLDEQMKAFKLWRAWEDRTRGRAPGP
jgi:hypothetical protein